MDATRPEKDTFRSISGPSTGLFKDNGSRFIAHAFPVSSEEEIKERISSLKKEYHDARHHCYAYRLGYRRDVFRANDDGEPSSSAGRPILGQIDSLELSALNENEDELLLSRSLRKASEDSSGATLQFSRGESPVLTGLGEIELIPVDDDFVMERVDGEHSKYESFHSLELKHARIRRRDETEVDSKRVHLSV